MCKPGNISGELWSKSNFSHLPWNNTRFTHFLQNTSLHLTVILTTLCKLLRYELVLKAKMAFYMFAKLPCNSYQRAHFPWCNHISWPQILLPCVNNLVRHENWTPLATYSIFPYLQIPLKFLLLCNNLQNNIFHLHLLCE